MSVGLPFTYDTVCMYMCFCIPYRALETVQSYSSGRCMHLISALFSQTPLLPAHQKYTALLDKNLDKVMFIR